MRVMDNKQISRVFEEIADLLELKESNPFRIRSFRRAAQIIESLTFDVSRAIQEDPERLRSISGIGSGTMEKIQELVDNGKCEEHEKLKEEIPASLLEITRLQGLGPKKAALFWKKLNITDINALEAAARAEKLRSLPGMGAKSEEKILQSIDEFKRISGRFRLDYATELSHSLMEFLRSKVKLDRISTAGSIRRRRETIGDIDILLTCDHPRQAISVFVQYPDVQEIVAQGDTKASVLLKQGLQVDLRVLEDDSFGAALQYFTGSKDHNVSLRERAKRMGFKINEYGLFRTSDDKKVAGREEEDIYKRLKLAMPPPEIRENRGELERAETGNLPRLIQLDDIQGDLHMHTTASDGRNSIAEMAEAGRRKGYRFIAITDHSKALAMTGGLDEKRVLAQIDEIETLRSEKPGLEIFTGIEVDILADGVLDLSDEVLSRLDVVIASIHSRFNLTRKEMTLRICKALENPHVNILAHPTGRLILKREPFALDLEEVVEQAVKNRVCLELNAYPARLDLNDVHCRMARDKGALIAINSDSHHTSMLDYLQYGIDTARRGWLEAEDVINTFPLKKLKQVLKKAAYR